MGKAEIKPRPCQKFDNSSLTEGWKHREIRTHLFADPLIGQLLRQGLRAAPERVGELALFLHK